MTISRRNLLKASAVSAVAPIAGCAHQVDKSKPTLELQALLAKATSQVLEAYPESASSAGVDQGEYAALKSRLSDRSLSGQARIENDVRSLLAQMKSFDMSALTADQALNLNVVRSVYEMSVNGFDLPYGDVALLNSNWSYRPSPYVVAQNTGAFVEIPSFLDSSHSISNGDDVDAYVQRMKAYATQLDGESERIVADGAKGAVLPDFLMKKTLGQLETTLATNVESWGLVSSVAKRSRDLSIGSDASAQAVSVAQQLVRPAIQRQIDALKSQSLKSQSHAGVWALPGGEEYYEWALRAGTTTNMSPDEVHQMGLDELARLHARMDPILKSIGYSKGSVGDRMTALAKDPRYQFADGDQGRQEIMAFINATIEDIRARMPQAFETLVPGFLEVTRIAPEVEAGAPGAYGGAGSVDGKKPGHFWINLRTPDLHNKFSLADLTYHEAIPGHVWQGEYTFKQSLLRSLLAFNAYSEGWALYAEQIADELGVYGDYPVGQLGYLQSLAFRACRLVVDTGLHSKRWTRAQANQWFVTNNGSNPDEVAGEVDRYCAWPGQACGYKVGHTAIVNLRQKAKEELGNKFDFRKFNDAVVLTGSVPMTVLDQVIDDYIQRAKA